MKQYVLRIVTAAIVCAAAGSFLDSKTAIGRLAKLLSGIFMAVMVISPLGNFAISEVSDLWEGLSNDASVYVTEGTAIAEKEKAGIIKSQTEAYILDKADYMGLQVAVEVELDEYNGNIPCGVVVSGNVSPYAQMQLGEYMEDTLGIAKENQKWK